MEAHLLPAKSLSLLLWRPHHPVLVTLLQACGANTLYLEYFTLLLISGWQFLRKHKQTLPFEMIFGMFPKTCARTGLGSAVPASRLAFSTSACNTSITWGVNIIYVKANITVLCWPFNRQKLTCVSRIFSATSLLTETKCWTITAPRSTISSSVLASRLSRQSFHCLDSNT